MYLPSYLVKRPSGIYHFRFSLPIWLRPAIGKCEIHKSLHTREPRKARILASTYLIAVSDLLDGQKQGDNMDRKAVLQRLGINPDAVAQYVKINVNGAEIVVDTQGAMTPDQEAQIALAALQKQSAPFVSDSARPQKPPSPTYQSSSHGKKLSEVYARYKVVKGTRWSEKTRMTYDRFFLTLCGLMKDPYVAYIGRPQASELLEVLMSYPANANKKPEFKDLTPTEIYVKNASLAKPNPPLDPHTVNIYLEKICALMDFAVNHGEADANPFKAIRAAEKPPHEHRRRGFTDQELQCIFQSDFFHNHKYKRSWQYWLPVLALYTGARINELAGLATDEVLQDNGTWVIDIQFRQNKDNHRLKNIASIRRIPVHPQLIALGLLDFVALRKKQRHWRLFPELSQLRGSYMKRPSDWFAKGKEKIFGLLDPDVTFHSFRYTVQIKMQLSQISAELRSAYLGHSLGKGAELDGGAAITVMQYGIKYPAAMLASTILPALTYNLNIPPYQPVKEPR